MAHKLKSSKSDPAVSQHRVVEFFRSSSHPHLAQFVAEVKEAQVILAGCCRSFYTKQVAQNVAARCPGVKQVVNTMQVQPTQGEAW